MTQTVDERIAALDKMLDEYDSKMGLTFFKKDASAETILNYSPAEIRALSEEECGEDGFVAQRYSGYIQKEANRINARMKWLHRCIDLECAARIKSYGDKFTSYQERLFLACNDSTNAYMKKLQDVLMHCEIRKEELSFLASKIGAMAQTLLEQRQVKRKTAKWE